MKSYYSHTLTQHYIGSICQQNTNEQLSKAMAVNNKIRRYNTIYTIRPYPCYAMLCYAMLCYGMVAFCTVRYSCTSTYMYIRTCMKEGYM
jgi:hypothetical protein